MYFYVEILIKFLERCKYIYMYDYKYVYYWYFYKNIIYCCVFYGKEKNSVIMLF